MKEGFDDYVCYYFGYLPVLSMFNFQYPVEGMKGIVWLIIRRQDLNSKMEKHMDYILQFSDREQ